MCNFCFYVWNCCRNEYKSMDWKRIYILLDEVIMLIWLFLYVVRWMKNCKLKSSRFSVYSHAEILIVRKTEFVTLMPDWLSGGTHQRKIYSFCLISKEMNWKEKTRTIIVWLWKKNLISESCAPNVNSSSVYFMFYIIRSSIQIVEESNKKK